MDNTLWTEQSFEHAFDIASSNMQGDFDSDEAYDAKFDELFEAALAEVGVPVN
jgi:hypothetical protein